MGWTRRRTRRQRIAAIRDKALKLIEVHGARPRVALGPTLSARLGPFVVAVMRPVPGMELTDEGLERICFWRRNRSTAHLRWLHIWATGVEVLLLRWETPSDGDVRVVRFRRGKWEELFLGLHN